MGLSLLTDNTKDRLNDDDNNDGGGAGVVDQDDGKVASNRETLEL